MPKTITRNSTATLSPKQLRQIQKTNNTAASASLGTQRQRWKSLKKTSRFDRGEARAQENSTTNGNPGPKLLNRLRSAAWGTVAEKPVAAARVGSIAFLKNDTVMMLSPAFDANITGTSKCGGEAHGGAGELAFVPVRSAFSSPMKIVLSSGELFPRSHCRSS